MTAQDLRDLIIRAVVKYDRDNFDPSELLVVSPIDGEDNVIGIEDTGGDLFFVEVKPA